MQKPTRFIAIGAIADRTVRAWDVLMKRLTYHRYVSQGGDGARC
jgi:hypothetical protein